MLVLIGVAVSLVYWSAPASKQRFQWVSRGAVIFVVAWIIATVGFGFYVSNFGSYNATYGSLGAVVILMTWMYFSALLLIVGAEINVVIAKARAEEAVVAESAVAAEQSRALDAAVHPVQTPGD